MTWKYTQVLLDLLNFKYTYKKDMLVLLQQVAASGLWFVYYMTYLRELQALEMWMIWSLLCVYVLRGGGSAIAGWPLYIAAIAIAAIIITLLSIPWENGNYSSTDCS